jgi:hypothetical protein
MEPKLVRLDDLQPYPLNPKEHDIGAIHTSIHEFGFLERIVVNETTGHILSGHGRLETLQQQRRQQMNAPEGIVSENGHWLVPVDYVTLDEDKEGAAVVALNRTTELGGWDDQKLVDLLQDVHLDTSELLAATGFDANDLDHKLKLLSPGTDAGYVVDGELNLKWTPSADDETEDNKVKDTYLPENLLIERNPAKRRMIISNKTKALASLIPQLPDPDTDLHIIAMGRGKMVQSGDVVKTFGFGNFVDYITVTFGGGCTVYLSTWSMNKDHVFMLLEFLESGRIADLHVLCDPNLTQRKKDIALMLEHGIGQFAGSRIGFFENHAKVYCFRGQEPGQFCTVTGSANLSGVPRSENYLLSTSKELYTRYVNDFFEVMFPLCADAEHAQPRNLRLDI